jgi:hypothetical protein
MIKCEYCCTYNKHWDSNCCACGAPLDYTKYYNGPPKFIVYGNAIPEIDFSFSGGLVKLNHSADVGLIPVVSYYDEALIPQSNLP